MSVPDESLEGLVKQARRTERALAKVTEAPPEPPPENETAAQAFTRRWVEQERAERRDEELARQVDNEHPAAPTAADLDDPLRAVARERRVRRRRLKRRLPR